jgi:3-keto-5-aminohexanoate cleavage enzyme
MPKRDKLIICAAIAGGATKKEQNQHVPYMPEEYADEVERCYNEGVSIVHLHAKDLKTGYGTIDLEANRKVFEAVRQRCPDMIVNISSASFFDDKETRILPITELRPEMCSFNTNSMNFGMVSYKTGEILLEALYRNPFLDQVFYARKMKAAGSKPEFEIFDPGGLNNIIGILDKQEGLFDHPMHFQFVYGVAGGMTWDQKLHIAMVDMLPAGSTWSVCGVGPNQVPAIFQAVISGGHTRIGLEDNIRNPDGSLSQGSWEQARWVKDLARIAGREIASCAEARAMLSLPERATLEVPGLPEQDAAGLPERVTSGLPEQATPGLREQATPGLRERQTPGSPERRP